MEVPARRIRPLPSAAPGQETGFEQFFRDNYRSVVRLAGSVLGDYQRAQDVAQEVFVAAHRRFGDGADQAAGWVRVAAVHLALNVLRGEQRLDRRHRQIRAAEAPADPVEAVIDRESREEVRSALGRLPRRAAAVLVLRHGGMSYAEVAAALGVKVGHVGSMLRRAEAALCKELDHAACE